MATDSFKLAMSYILVEADTEELNAFVEAIKQRRARIASVNRYALVVGTAVKFTHKGIEYNGTVKAIRVKKAVVECAHPNAANIRAYDSKLRPVPATVSYTVPLSMLVAA